MQSLTTVLLSVCPPDKIIETPTWIQVRVRYFGSHVLLWAAILLLLNLSYNPLVKHILSIHRNQYRYGFGYCQNSVRMQLHLCLHYLVLCVFFNLNKIICERNP